MEKTVLFVMGGLLLIQYIYGAYSLAVSGKPISKGKGVYIYPAAVLLVSASVFYFFK